MKLHFSGTGAADWSPQFQFQPGYRRNSSALIDSGLLIDPGPDIFDFAGCFGYSELFSSLKLLLITHSHRDHFNLQSVKKLAELNSELIIGCDYEIARMLENEGIKAVDLRAFEEYTLAAYKVTPLDANHSTELKNEKPFHYVIEKDGKRLYYATDGAWILKHSWLWLYKNPGFDAMVFDATIGFGYPGDFRIFEHNSLEMLCIMCETLRAQNILKPNCKLIATHLARKLHPEQNTLEESLKQHGIIAAYDNLSLEI